MLLSADDVELLDFMNLRMSTSGRCRATVLGFMSVDTMCSICYLILEHNTAKSQNCNDYVVTNLLVMDKIDTDRFDIVLIFNKGNIFASASYSELQLLQYKNKRHK